jgi:hypothetical protein
MSPFNMVSQKFFGFKFPLTSTHLTAELDLRRIINNLVDHLPYCYYLGNVLRLAISIFTLQTLNILSYRILQLLYRNHRQFLLISDQEYP